MGFVIIALYRDGDDAGGFADFTGDWIIIMSVRVGFGYDVHAFCEGRPLILGGVKVPYEKGLLGHSDADVLVHAIIDAILGAVALGDIGQHFPDTDPAYKGANSLDLLTAVMDLIRRRGYEISNVDATVVAQRPKLMEYILPMRHRIAETMGVDLDRVSVKATTSEKMGFVGREEGMACHAVAALVLHS